VKQAVPEAQEVWVALQANGRKPRKTTILHYFVFRRMDNRLHLKEEWKNPADLR
jgi:hypothetical protein